MILTGKGEAFLRTDNGEEICLGEVEVSHCSSQFDGDVDFSDIPGFTTGTVAGSFEFIWYPTKHSGNSRDRRKKRRAIARQKR